MAQSKWIGQTIGGRYQIEALLGQGGMSAVYRANDPNLRRPVAIKLIHAHLSGEPDFVRRFQEEAAAVARLRHPNIIQVYDFNNDDDTYYIVFEFIPGETLQARLKRMFSANRQLETEETVNTIATLAEAIDYAHKQGLVHRDIKPANVMMNVHNQPILMDFGIVKIVGGTQHTATGATVGTARYMAPEQIRGEQVDGRTDIYSLGVTLFEMLSGRAPFEADSAMTVMMMHINDPVPSLALLRPDLPPALVAIVNKCLAKNPATRFQTAGDMATALRQSLKMPAGKPTIAPVSPADATVVESSPLTIPPKPAKPAPQPAPAIPPPAAQPIPQPTAQPSNNRSQLLIAAAALGALFLVCLLVSAILILPSLQKETATPTQPVVAALTETPTPPVNPTDTQQATIVGPATTEIPPLAATPTSPPPATATLPPPTDTPPPSPTAGPTDTATVPVIPYARINNITINSDNRYVVDYETFGYSEGLPGQHVHFFFNTVDPANAGVPGSGPWVLYGGPRPFTGYSLAERPAGATQLCILVANANHSIQLGSGNCFDLPG